MPTWRNGKKATMNNDNNVTPIRANHRTRLAPPTDADLAVLNKIMSDTTAAQLSVSNYQEDKAVRRAMLHASKARTWPTAEY